MVNAVLEFRDYVPLAVNVRAELVAWRVPYPVRGSAHVYKYCFALIAAGECVLRYDNEAGKGDHRHVGNREFAYDFVGLDRARHDVLAEARDWVRRHAAD